MKDIFLINNIQQARYGLLKNLLQKNANNLTDKDLNEVAEACDGYSGANNKTLCTDAAMHCFRELSKSQFMNVNPENVRFNL
jgi:SpoVK/Ycf46/Vps4 family AAA+-type ATPase